MNHVSLGEVSEFIRGVTFKPEQLVDNKSAGSLVCMRTKNVQSDLDVSDLISVPSDVVKNKKKILTEGDLLVSTANSFKLVGKTCWVPKLDYPATAGGFISILRADDTLVDRRYLFHWMISNRIQHKLRYCGRQTTNISNMSFEQAQAIKIPLPPLKEQKRIAAILDKADAIRRKRQQAIELADQFLRSVFLDMFGDPVTNPKGWLKKKISEIGDVATGNTPSRKIEAYYGGYIEWIKSDNINTPNHILTEASEYLSEEGTKVARIVTAGSILVTCIAGSMDCIGNIALSNRRVAFNQQINSITPFEADQLRFIYAQLLYNKNLVQEASTKSMKGMVSKSKFSDIELIVPDKKSCQKFSQLFAETNNWTDKLTVQLTISNSIFDALAQQAFSGELSEAKAA